MTLGYTVTVADQVPFGGSQVGVRSLILDVSTAQGATSAVEQAAGDDGLHALVNCLGISPKKDGRKIPFAEITLEDWNLVFTVNVTSCFLTMQAAMTHLARDGSASIVNFISSVAKLGAGGPEGASFGPFHPAAAHYCASKAALANLTISVAREVADGDPVQRGRARVYRSRHGRLDGTCVRRGGATASCRSGGVADRRKSRASWAFCSATDASYVTGEIIDIDGGWDPD